MEFFAPLPTLTSSAFTLMPTLVLPSPMEPLRLPGPAGYVLAGIILGPRVLSALNPDGKIVQFFSDIGKLLLMFFAGYEVDIEQFNRARRKDGNLRTSHVCRAVLARRRSGWPSTSIGRVMASSEPTNCPILSRSRR